MEFPSAVRRSAALCLAVVAPAWTLSAASAAQAAPTQSDCAELNTLNSGFSTTMQDVIGPEELEKLAKSNDATAGEALGKGMAKRLFETDPVTGRPRMELFIEHLRDLDALAHDSSAAFDDPEGAEAAQKLADRLDGYLGFYDRLNDRQDDQLEGQGDEQQDRRKDEDRAGEAPDNSALLEEMGPVLDGFNGGIDAFTAYSERAGCRSV